MFRDDKSIRKFKTQTDVFEQSRIFEKNCKDLNEKLYGIPDKLLAQNVLNSGHSVPEGNLNELDMC